MHATILLLLHVLASLASAQSNIPLPLLQGCARDCINQTTQDAACTTQECTSFNQISLMERAQGSYCPSCPQASDGESTGVI